MGSCGTNPKGVRSEIATKINVKDMGKIVAIK